MNKTKIIFIILAGSIMAIALWNLNANRLQKGSTALRDYEASENSNLQNRTNINTEKESEISKVCFNEKCFNAEIADTPKKHTQGLMNRKSLDQNSGMLFIFDTEAKYKFWMKNTLIPLDIIWLDKNKRVVFIKHNAESCETNPCKTFGPSKNAKYVLEINSGLAKKIELKEEDYLEFR